MIVHRIFAASDEQILKASLLAGLDLYGLRLPVDKEIAKYAKKWGIDLSPYPKVNGSGLVWMPTEIVRMKYSDFVVRELKSGVGSSSMVVDDFAYGFDPKTNKGQDCASKSYKSVKQVSGTLYIYNVEEIHVLTADFDKVAEKVKVYKKEQTKKNGSIHMLNKELVKSLAGKGVKAEAVKAPSGSSYLSIEIVPGSNTRLYLDPSHTKRSLYAVFELKKEELAALQKLAPKLWQSLEELDYPIPDTTLHGVRTAGGQQFELKKPS